MPLYLTFRGSGKPNPMKVQSRVCQHCWSKVAVVSDPNLCGECDQEFQYYLNNGHVTPAYTQANFNRAEQEVPRG